MKRLLLAVALGSSLFAPVALADEACACGMAGCEHACTCSAGVCPLHRPGKGPGAGPRGPGAGALPAFDAKTVTTVKGTVTAVERHAHGDGQVGVHLTVSAGAETLEVHLGPAAFVDPKLTFAKGDAVTVVGSRVTVEGAPALLATVVTRGTTSLTLRAADGTPRFRGQGRP